MHYSTHYKKAQSVPLFVIGQERETASKWLRRNQVKREKEVTPNSVLNDAPLLIRAIEV
jgi:hypothetical protein